MTEVSDSGRVTLESAGEAKAFARTHFDTAHQKISGIPYDQDFLSDPPDPLSNYFFKLQSDVESDGGGGMDYHEYARRMWTKFFGEPQDIEADEAFSLFENRMITNLHSIEMNRIVYPHVVENLEMLTSMRGPGIRELVLWSTGDVAASGYQAAKIDRSGIVPRYMRAVVASNPEGAREVMEKTRYMVDDNKFERIADHVEKLRQSGEENIKLVVIEDSVKNFGKVREIVDARLGVDGASVEIVPIWATYSREGQQARKKAESSVEALGEYEGMVDRLNGINSFSELLGDRFNDIFKDAHVFCDFDGVIGDNIEMRKQQARAIFGALTEGGMKSGLTIPDIDQKLTTALAPQE